VFVATERRRRPDVANACGTFCDSCPAAARCGKTCNFCVVAHHRLRRCEGCGYCPQSPLLDMDVRRRIMDHLGGLDFTWPSTVNHPGIPELPPHLPVLVQAYADEVQVPWVMLHGGRLFGRSGRLTLKHHRPLREVYRLGPDTKIGIEFFVEDSVLEALWANRAAVNQMLARLGADLVLAPNYSVWVDHPRMEALIQQRRAFIHYHQLLEAGVTAVPDVGFSLFEPDGRLWAEWVNSQPTLQAVSLFCGGRKIHASRTAHVESVEDVALFHETVRPEVAFILGGVHAPDRLRDYRAAAPGRRLTVCNGMAYSLAQRRRLLDDSAQPMARSARDCFLRNCTHNDLSYANLLSETTRAA
jgi:hypothetical protein